MITLQVTQDQLNLLDRALGVLPYNEVAGLMQSLISQVAAARAADMAAQQAAMQAIADDVANVKEV